MRALFLIALVACGARAHRAQPPTTPPKPEVPEKVPLKYRDPESKELLKAEVKGGSNTIDFALETGPIEPPQAKGDKGKAKKKGPVLCY